MFRGLLSVIFVLAVAASAAAQGQAINGTIEGTVTDQSGGALPGVSVTVANTDTGSSRTVVTNDSGVYRALLLPLGSYRVTAELQGFRRYEQTGVNLSAGQVAVVNIAMGVGAVSEIVSVTADSPIVDLAKTEQGRTLTEEEIKTLPLTSRNPYNFALLQPGVVGFETQEFGVPRLTANGALLRVNYQIDGNDNTQKDRAGLRQMPMSEVMIREVKVVTSGYAPEFGQTMGLVYNAVTPSGANTLKGQASYRFQREPLVALPFFSTTTVKPPTDVNIFTVDNGGPIVRDRTFYFGGFESTKRDLSGTRVITITPANAARLGLNEPAYMPTTASTKFAIGKIDHVLSTANRLSVRYIFFDNAIANNIGGGLNSVQRGTDFLDRQHSTAGQLISTIGNNMLNEVRVQYATRAQSRSAGAQAATGPSITVTGVAQFGGPVPDANGAGFGFTENQFQILDNFTHIRGNHAYKFGASVESVKDTRTQVKVQLYNFATVDAYLAARSGASPFGYTSFQQFFGNPDIEYTDVDVCGLRSGRLAPHARPQASLWLAIRRLCSARRGRQCAHCQLGNVQDRQEQPAAARRAGLDARRQQEDRAACQFRADVRPATQCRLRAGAPERRHDDAWECLVHANASRRAGVSERVRRRYGCGIQYRLDRGSRRSRSGGCGRAMCWSSGALAIAIQQRSASRTRADTTCRS